MAISARRAFQTFGLIGLSCLVCPLVLAAPAATRTAAPKKDVQEILKAEVSSQKTKIGSLSEWQEKVFDDELVPQYPRFVRDYRPGGNGVIADIDVPGIKSYLAYGPGDAKGEAAQIQVLLIPEKDCDRCREAFLPLKRLVKNRLERRGFVPNFVEPAAVGDDGQLTGAAINERLAELARKKESAGALLLQWQLAPVDPDSPHADEKQYQVRVFETARAPKVDWKHEGNIEILENDSIISACEKLLSDAVTDFGARTLAIGETKGPSSTNAPEFLVSVSGIRGWSHYIGLKSKFQSSLQGAGWVEERFLSRGRAGFVVRTQKPRGVLESMLVAVAGEGVVLKVEAQ